MIIGGLTFALRPITLLSSIILARILDPADFGAVALAMVLLGSTELFAALSMQRAYIQSDFEPEKVAFHAFMITVVSSVTIFAFTFINADWLSRLLGDASITPVLRALALLIPINAWGRVPEGVLLRELKFGSMAKSSALATISYLVVTVLLAVLGLGVWSLVIGNLAHALVGTIMVWVLAPGWSWLKPVRWDREVFRSLMRYGIPATGAGLVSFFSSKWDDWLVGRQLGVESLGFYSKAYDFTNRTISQFGSKVVGGVFFPTYTKIKDNTRKLQNAYFKSVQLIATLMNPIALGFLATAHLTIPVLLGDKWLPMIPAFQVFSILILTRPISGNTSSIFAAVGVPKNNLQAGLVLTAVLIPSALLLIRFGIAGVAVAVLLGDTAGLLFNMYRIHGIIPDAVKGTIKASAPSLAAALIMYVIVTGVQMVAVARLGVNAWSLAIAVGTGIVVYGLAILLLQREFVKELWQTLIQVVDSNGRLARVRSAVWHA